MIPANNNEQNIERFKGFAGDYDMYRPGMPKVAIDILLKYLKRKPGLVVDIGCGTGLSTFPWGEHAEKVIGLDPSEDMLKKGNDKLYQKYDFPNVSFRLGYSNQTGLESGTVDIVTCSQSFHWMDPDSTLEEISRILKEGGVFAAYDYDWPPTIDWLVEQDYRVFTDKVDEVFARISSQQDLGKHWNKREHFKNIKESNRFRFVKEILFHDVERGDARRFVGGIMSWGSVQTVLKINPKEIEKDIRIFQNAVEQKLGNKEVDIYYSYRMRLGIK